MRIVVTGGAGYIGSVVCEALVRRGDETLVLDNLSKGHRDAVVDGARLLELDLLDRGAVTRALPTFMLTRWYIWQPIRWSGSR